MKAIFNKNEETEIILYFSNIVEIYSKNTSNVLSLEIRKNDLKDTESMIDYCLPILNLDVINTIYCYQENNNENEEDKLIITFNKYNTVYNCRTIIQDSNDSNENNKQGILVLIQK